MTVSNDIDRMLASYFDDGPRRAPERATDAAIAFAAARLARDARQFERALELSEMTLASDPLPAKAGGLSPGWREASAW